MEDKINNNDQFSPFAALDASLEAYGISGQNPTDFGDEYAKTITASEGTQPQRDFNPYDFGNEYSQVIDASVGIQPQVGSNPYDFGVNSDVVDYSNPVDTTGVVFDSYVAPENFGATQPTYEEQTPDVASVEPQPANPVESVQTPFQTESRLDRTAQSSQDVDEMIRQLEAEKRQLESKLQALDAEKSAPETEIVQLERRVEGQVQEIDELGNKARHLKLKKLKSQTYRLKSRVEEETAEIEEKRVKLQALRSKSEKNDEAIAMLTSSIASMESDDLDQTDEIYQKVA